MRLMKNLSLSFLAQRLDNQDPDHMAIQDRDDLVELAEEDMDKREKLDRQISKVSLDGSQVYLEGHHAAFLLKNEFLLETPSDQRTRLAESRRFSVMVACHRSRRNRGPAMWSKP